MPLAIHPPETDLLPPLPRDGDQWTNVYRSENEHGQITHATYQELWADRYQRHLHARPSETVTA